MTRTETQLIIGEDDDRVYLYKPAGLPVFPPHVDPEGDCLWRRLLQARPEQAGPWPEGFAGGLAHRLDNLTSGLVIAAKTPAALESLRSEFQAHQLRKFYVFRSAGVGPSSPLLLETPLAHHPRKKDRMVAMGHPGTAHRGKWYPAWTRFSKLSPGLWQAEIRTGVMHQIRVHAAWAGIPLSGDTLYGGEPGMFFLHHREVWGPRWRSAVCPSPDSLA